MTNELKEIHFLLKANELSLNIKKTHFMIFPSKNTPHPNACININGETINETTKTKFFGVIIDNKLEGLRNLEGPHLVHFRKTGKGHRCVTKS